MKEKKKEKIEVKKTESGAEKKIEKKLDKDLVELLSPRRAIRLKVQKYLENFPKNYTSLLLIEPKDYARYNIELIRYLIENEDRDGIYVSFNKSFKDLYEDLFEEEIDVERIHFVDAVTRGTGRTEIKSKQVTYIEAPNNLVELNVAIEKTINSIDKPAFLIFDSVSTLLLYNSVESSEKFMHSLIGKIREWQLKGILLMVKSHKQQGIIDVISQFCDRTIELA